MATSIVAHWSCRATQARLRVLSVAAALLAPAAPAQADGWGCQVMLCLSDPRGPEAEGACVAPIERLWDHLAHGHPFPTCDLMESWDSLSEETRSAIPVDVVQSMKSTTISGGNGGASGSFCPYDLMYSHPRFGYACRARSVIQVRVDGKVFTRVWWGIGGITEQSRSRTEYFGEGSTTPFYDPAESAKRWIDDFENNGNEANGAAPRSHGPGKRH